MNFTARSFAWNTADAEVAARIRFTVFVDEQKVPAEEELDETDKTAFHVLVLYEDKAVGTGRLYQRSENVGRVGRMAVLREWRGRGAGRVVMTALLQEALARGYESVMLDAQVHAVGFYESFGFQVYGDLHDDAGIPHRYMRASAEDIAQALDAPL